MAGILVLDDDEDFRCLLQKSLQKVGHRVICAADGWQGLEELASFRTDLIITDIFMPGKDGFEFMLDLLRQPPIGVDIDRIGIIAMTGGGNMVINNSMVMRIAHRLGAVEVIMKPFDMNELYEKVDAILGRKSIPEECEETEAKIVIDRDGLAWGGCSRHAPPMFLGNFRAGRRG
ncbi:MAG: response regulator [Magnetococcales bacterium]|nr:response regulator [Magnetococcales bacterium]MBF0156039.1 response regulator [Magnetococcales bacterium]